MNIAIEVTDYDQIPRKYTGRVKFIHLGTYYCYVNGLLHRLDGPAMFWHTKSGTEEGYYYINNRCVSKEQVELLRNLMELKGISPNE